MLFPLLALLTLGGLLVWSAKSSASGYRSIPYAGGSASLSAVKPGSRVRVSKSQLHPEGGVFEIVGRDATLSTFWGEYLLGDIRSPIQESIQASDIIALVSL